MGRGSWPRRALRWGLALALVVLAALLAALAVLPPPGDRAQAQTLPACEEVLLASHQPPDGASERVDAANWKAQGFPPAQTARVTRAVVRASNFGDQGDALLVQIRNDTGGVPDGTDGDGIAAGAVTGAGGNPVNVPLAPNPVLSGGAVYHLVFGSTATSGNGFFLGAQFPGAYPLGSVSFSDTRGQSWGADAELDL